MHSQIKTAERYNQKRFCNTCILSKNRKPFKTTYIPTSDLACEQALCSQAILTKLNLSAIAEHRNSTRDVHMFYSYTFHVTFLHYNRVFITLSPKLSSP